ncbi:uncharacterized protein [Palaemon carinicauda]|uniref:uncharacterized protein n=1 Tax=Palaemon carinicauda TaxID=392227 RepID=UPI0035B5DE16
MLLRLLVPGILFLAHYSKAVVINNGEDSAAPQGSHNNTRPCTCVPFFTCAMEDIVSPANGGICVSSNQACCKSLDSGARIERCTTPGTTQGYCLEFKDCLAEMMPHLKTVPLAEFVERFGCGRASPESNVRVCCSTAPR